MGARWPPALSPRLRGVADFIPAGARVADIGADHGLLALWLLVSGRAEWCVATETDPMRLPGIAGLPEGDPRASRLERRAGDGLEPLGPEDRLGVAVLAGLGARRICRILASPHRRQLGIPRFVLQPQAEPWRLRRWLIESGLRISAEALVEDRGRSYAILAAEEEGVRKGGQVLT